jgi:hypothetical protein
MEETSAREDQKEKKVQKMPGLQYVSAELDTRGVLAQCPKYSLQDRPNPATRAPRGI